MPEATCLGHFLLDFFFDLWYNKSTKLMKGQYLYMAIKVNPDKEIVDTIREGLKRTGGYCPCVREQSEDTKCMCKQFKEQIKDPNFEGYCHCQLYYKEK